MCSLRPLNTPQWRPLPLHKKPIGTFGRIYDSHFQSTIKKKGASACVTTPRAAPRSWCLCLNKSPAVAFIKLSRRETRRLSPHASPPPLPLLFLRRPRRRSVPTKRLVILAEWLFYNFLFWTSASGLLQIIRLLLKLRLSHVWMTTLWLTAKPFFKIYIFTA